MKSAKISLFPILASLFLFGCQPEKKETTAQPSDEVPMAPIESRSPAFEAVSSNLALGGDMYFFLDTTAMLEKVEETLPAMMNGLLVMPNTDPEARQILTKLSKLDWSAVIADLGFSKYTAFGMSSYPLNGNYRNQSMLYLPKGYEGFMKIYDGDLGSLQDELALAPADTDVFYSVGMNLKVMKPLVSDFLGKYVSTEIQNKFDTALNNPIPNESFTIADLWEQVPTRLTLILKAGEDIGYPFPASEQGMIMLPKLDFVLALQGNSEFWRGLIEKQLPPSFAQENLGDVSLRLPPPGFMLPGGLIPCLGFDTTNDRIYLASSSAYLKAALDDGPRLSASANYVQATNGLKTADAQDMFYMSSNAYTKLADIRQNINEIQPMASFMVGVYSIYFPILQAGPHPNSTALVMLRQPNGLVTEANWAYQPSLATMQMGSGSQTVVVTGMLAAMAIPAFNKVREQSREKAITNNLRLVASAGQQYILENGVPQARYQQLEGTYFAPISPVNGEDYTGLIVEEQGGTLTVMTADGEEVSYTY